MQASEDRATLRSILFADLENYSRLTASREGETLAFVSRCFALFQAHCADYGGEFIKNTGDGVVILFEGVSSAIDYALFVQARLAELAQGGPLAARFRIGLHSGEVHRRDGDVFGHAVNVAARVEAHAEPGGVCVTQDVFWAARNSSRYVFRFAGRPALKNLPEPLSLYHVAAAQMEEPARAPQQRIVVIDGLAIYSGEGEAMPLRSRKAQALVGYIALSRELAGAQDRIATLIWPERSLSEARKALSQCLHQVEKALGSQLSPVVVRRGNLVGLSPSRVSVDLVRMIADLGEARVEEVLLTRDDWAEAILLGLEDTSGLFKAWLSVTRHNWRNQVLEALEAVLDRFDPAQPPMRRAATALLVLEPSHERAAQCLIRHYRETGNAAAAMRVYERLRAVLRDEYQMEPSQATMALVGDMTAPRPAPAAPVARRAGHAPTLAVDRFRTGGRKLTRVAGGFRAELIANLSKFREFTVVETASDGTGRADADYLLSGECGEDAQGARLFITVQEPATMRVVWSESHALALGNWLQLQRELVGRILSTLEVYLSHDRLSRTVQRLPQDLGVYDAWLRGEDLLTRWTPAAEDEAERLFEQAIATDANFAPAHASLASIHNSRQFIRPGSATSAATSERALQLAERSVMLDPLDARNQLVVAWSTAMARRFEQSEVHYELAATLNPNSPRTLVSVVLGLAFMGRVDLASGHLARAMDLTSMFLDYQWSHIATIRYFAADFEGVVAASDRSRNAIIDTVGWKAAALQRLGRIDEARAAMAQLCDTVGAAWAGADKAGSRQIVDWFLAAFPIRHDEHRRDLARLQELV